VQGGRLVSGIETDAAGNVTALVARDTASGAEERYEADAVVFAISIAGKHGLGKGQGRSHQPSRQALGSL